MARNFAMLFIEMHDISDERLDGYGLGEIDLVLMARKILEYK